LVIKKFLRDQSLFDEAGFLESKSRVTWKPSRKPFSHRQSFFSKRNREFLCVNDSIGEGVYRPKIKILNLAQHLIYAKLYTTKRTH